MKNSSFRYYPLALFSSVMGLSSVTIATRQLEVTYSYSFNISTFLLVITVLWFFFNMILFIYRLVKFPKDVKREFNHPIQMNFFAAISISFLLLATSFVSVSSQISLVLWVIGALMQSSLTIAFLHNLLWKESFHVSHFTPLSFLPIVGNLVVPIAGSEHVHEQINFFFFGFGILFSIIYLTFMFHRLFFHQQLPVKMLPTIFILLAPPAVAFVAYVQITNTIDRFANLLYGIAFFIGVLLLMQLKKILSNPFSLPAWALLFPSGAMTIATIMMYRETNFYIYSLLNIVQIIGLVILVLYLAWQTIMLAKTKKLCSPGG